MLASSIHFVMAALKVSCCLEDNSSARRDSFRSVSSSTAPEVPFPSLRVIEALGEHGLRQLVAQHHALLRQSAIGHLFAQDAAQFAQLVERVADFVVEACGGAAQYTPAHGHTCMRTRHFPFTIDEAAREVWLTLLWQALADCAAPAAVREEYWAWMEPFSLRMINRRTTKAQPARWAYAEMAARHA